MSMVMLDPCFCVLSKPKEILTKARQHFQKEQLVHSKYVTEQRKSSEAYRTQGKLIQAPQLE